MVQEDKYSTKSVNGSQERMDFSKYNNLKISHMFESMNVGAWPDVIDRKQSGTPGLNRSNPSNVAASEIAALKRELEKKYNKPVYLNIMVIGRRSSGKSSFIKMLLNYVVLLW